MRLLLPLLSAIALLPATARAEPAGAGLQAELRQRAADAVAALQGKAEPGRVFTPAFLATVPAERLLALGRAMEADGGAVRGIGEPEADGPGAARFVITLDRARVTARLSIEEDGAHRITRLVLAPPEHPGDTAPGLLTEFNAMPGHNGFAIVWLKDTGPSPVLSSRPDQQFAIGSAFKLWVLLALADEIAAGRRRWDEVVRLGTRAPPGGAMRDWPSGTPVTLQTLAIQMIAASDNTATDTLMKLLGRDRIGQTLRALGHSDPSRTLPLLTTTEAFSLKRDGEQATGGYADLTDEQQSALLDRRARRISGMRPPAGYGEKPQAIETVEWFASPNDIARTLDALRRHRDPAVREILSVAPHLDHDTLLRVAYAGYKGGSEIGVLNLSWLLRDRSGRWFAVTASWNDPQAPLDTARLEAFGLRLVQLVLRGGG